MPIPISAERLERQMLERGLDHLSLARLAKVDSTTIWRICSGRTRGVHPATLERIVKALKERPLVDLVAVNGQGEG